MARDWAWSDLHLGHENGLKSRGWFDTLDEYHEYVSDLWVSRVGKRDTVHLVGDIALTWDGLQVLAKLPGRKIDYLGNHCKQECTIRDLLEVFDDIEGLYKHRKGFYISHAPIHPTELRGRRNIHGHTHNKIIPDQRYINVCIDLLRDGPVSMDDIYSGKYRSYRDPIS